MAKINTEYDIGKAFKAIEDELIASMIRNMKRHKVEEITEAKQWSMWQAEMLKGLEKYKKANKKKYGGQFKSINDKIEVLIYAARTEGGMDQEEAILKAIKDGFKAEKLPTESTAQFFKVNDRKLNTLVNATTNDMQKAETAVLRMADDQYRKVIYNAQVYANSGAGTYEKAVDMATKDFLAAGLNCVEYKNGARHTLADYADMAIRTACKRAYLQGEGEKRQEWGLHLVIMNKRGNPCSLCLPFVGKIMIDDVWSGGSRKDGNYPLMSTAIEAGLYHPRCRDSHTTYFPGITTVDPRYNKQEIKAVEKNQKQEAHMQIAERQWERYNRLAKFSLDPENRKNYEYAGKRFKHARFKTGDIDADDYSDNIRAKRFLGKPIEITNSWPVTEAQGSVSDLKEFAVDDITYQVDGKKIKLNYSKHEKEVAENLAALYGKNIKMVPKITYPQNIQTPDYEIDGVGWDLKEIHGNGKNVLYNAIKKKRKQASHFIFEIKNNSLSDDELQKQVTDLFRSTHLAFVDEVAIYKDGKIKAIYGRKK